MVEDGGRRSDVRQFDQHVTGAGVRARDGLVEYVRVRDPGGDEGGTRYCVDNCFAVIGALIER